MPAVSSPGYTWIIDLLRPDGTLVRVLLVDDDPDWHGIVERLLRDSGQPFTLDTASNYADGLAQLRLNRHDLYLIDLLLGAYSGLTLIEAGGQLAVDGPMILLTGAADAASDRQAMGLGAADYLDKTQLTAALLTSSIRHALMRRKTELALRSRERELRAVFEHTLDAILIYDDERRHIGANPAAVALIGVPLSRLRDLRLDDLSPAERRRDLDKEWTGFLRNGFQRGQYVLQRPDTTLRTVDYSGVANFLPGQHLFMVRDVTDQWLLEQQLAHSRRIESVGRLAGGIAHDFNNLLTAILGNVDMLIDRQPADGERVHLDEIKRAAESAAGLTRQLLAFSRRQVLQPIVIDVNDRLSRLSGLLQRLIGEHIVLSTDLQGGSLRIKVDPNQFEQVLFNLAVNARDAMPTGGLLRIRSNRLVIRDEYVRDAATIPPGTYASIVVEDTGMGMEADTLQHLFEPFFTTKERGHGTGLGLATVYGIVKQSGGFIWVNSARDKGTQFEIQMPASSEPIPVVARETPHPAVRSASVLLVDDDDAVRSLAVRVLKRAGYQVTAARDGEEALSLTAAGPYALLITDVVMPRMSGIELFERITLLQPTIKVLFMSGYADLNRAQFGTLPPAGYFIEKPFTPASLAAKAAEALDATPRK